MAFAHYIPAAIILPSSGGTITHLEDIPFDPALEDLMVRAAGSNFPGFTGSNRSSVAYSLSTTQLKTVLDFCTSDDVSRDTSGGNLDLEYQQVVDLATRGTAVSTVHSRHRVARSLMAWESIDASEGGPASLSFKIMPTSTDDTNPVTIANGVAMASSATVGTVYGLGPIKIDGTLYCVERWGLNLGIEYKMAFCSGGPYLRFAAVVGINPVLTATVSNQTEALANWSTGGAGLSTSAVAFLRKRAAGGINVANATAEHIAITGTAGTVKPAGRNEIRIHLHNIAVDTAAAIA